MEAMQIQPSTEPQLRGPAAWTGYPFKAASLLWRYGAETLVVLLMAVMVGTIILQVYCRFVLGNPLSWSEELARYAFVWITFLGAAVAYRHGSHIIVETIVALLPGRAQLVLAWVVDALMVVALVVLLVQGLNIVEVNSNVEATMLEIPMSWVYAAVPVSAAVMLAYQVERTIRRIKGTLPALTTPASEEAAA
jgi:TRAP-type C4-dicarboxylate transport system permease small subunit